MAGLAAYVVLSELDLDGQGGSAGLLLLVQQPFGVGHPGQQLIQSMLELPQCQQRPLQFVLQTCEGETNSSSWE